MSRCPRPEALLPHRKPMLLLERLLALSEEECLAESLVPADAFYVQGHYPDFPIVPGVITCESLFQAGAALMAYRMSQSSALPGDDRVPVVARIESAKFKRPIRPGDKVMYKVRFREQMGPAYFLEGEARVNDRVAATVSFACALAPKAGAS